MTQKVLRSGLASSLSVPVPKIGHGADIDCTLASLGLLGDYGGAMRIGQWTEIVTLDTGGATTDTTNTVPANSLVLAVNTRVTTAFGTAASFTLGDSSTAARYMATNSTVTVNARAYGVEAMEGGVSTDATGPYHASAAAIRITCNATPSAGALMVQCWYIQFTAPSETPE